MCAPFRVSRREGVGRCLVATRDVDAGELLFVERPAVVGPLHETSPVCLTCFKKVRSDVVRISTTVLSNSNDD